MRRASSLEEQLVEYVEELSARVEERAAHLRKVTADAKYFGPAAQEAALREAKARAKYASAHPTPGPWGWALIGTVALVFLAVFVGVVWTSLSAPAPGSLRSKPSVWDGGR